MARTRATSSQRPAPDESTTPSDAARSDARSMASRMRAASSQSRAAARERAYALADEAAEAETTRDLATRGAEASSNTSQRPSEQAATREPSPQRSSRREPTARSSREASTTRRSKDGSSERPAERRTSSRRAAQTSSASRRRSASDPSTGGKRAQRRPVERDRGVRTESTARGSRRVNALDGIRVLAMLAIVVYHANATWLPGGFIGVTAFFTISGYLITDSLLREYQRTGGIDVMRFYQRRLLRLVPLMVVVVACTALLCAAFAPQLLEKMRGDALPALLFCENWWYILREQSYFAASGLPSPLTHFWFLGVLGQFYLIWPWFTLLTNRILPNRTWQRRLVALLAVASAVLAATLFDPKGDPSRVYYGTDTRMAEILIGVWLAYAWPTDRESGLAHWVESVLPFPQLLDLVGLVSLVALSRLCFAVNGYSPILYRGGLLLVAVLTALLIACVVRPSSLLAKPLGMPPLPAIAARSFGVYLWHYGLLLVMNPATRTKALPWWGWVIEALVIAAVVEASYRLVEQPFSTLGAKRGAQGSPSARPSLPLIGTMALICLAAGALIVVGPFWYKDGALAQAGANEGGSSQATAGSNASSPTGAGVPEVLDTTSFLEVGEGIETEGHSIATAVVDTARALEIRIRGYEIDPSTGKTNAPVILIGDSVPAGAIDQFYEIFPYGYIDAEVGRQLYVADDVYLDAVAAGNDRDIVVFASGDNGVADDDDMQHLLDAAAGHQIYLVTVRVPYPLQDMNNELFRSYAERYDNVEVIDWYAESEGHDEYFWDDGTHLRPEGAEAYVLMLRRAIVGE